IQTFGVIRSWLMGSVQSVLVSENVTIGPSQTVADGAGAVATSHSASAAMAGFKPQGGAVGIFMIPSMRGCGFSLVEADLLFGLSVRRGGSERFPKKVLRQRASSATASLRAKLAALERS